MTVITDTHTLTIAQLTKSGDITQTSTRLLEASQRQAVQESLQFYSSPTSLLDGDLHGSVNVPVDLRQDGSVDKE
eukprot:1948422-Rhodomonas_salina.1